MTIYRQEASRGGKRNPRCAKIPSLSRKRNSFKRLPPIYEIDEDFEEVSFLELARDNNKHSLRARRLGNVDCDPEGIFFQINATAPHEEESKGNKMHRQQQRCGEFRAEDSKETCGYLKRNLGNNSPARGAERNNQMVFPDFFPPGMHVHCAQNALPEASKGLYMKIMQGESELEHARNICKTNKTANANNNSSYKQQNWMQFFG